MQNIAEMFKLTYKEVISLMEWIVNEQNKDKLVLFKDRDLNLTDAYIRTGLTMLLQGV